MNAQAYARRLVRRFWSKVEKGPGCWLWMAGKFPDGYGQFSVKATPVGAHRVSYELANGPIPDGLFVLHRCDNPPCVNPAHLFLGTHAVNVADKCDKQRQAIGEQHGRAKLTVPQVIEIRRLYRTGCHSFSRLAASFGVSDSNVKCIVQGHTWKQI